MADKLMYIPNDDTQNYPFEDKMSDWNVELKKNKNSVKISKVVESTNKNKTLGTSDVTLVFKRKMMHTSYPACFVIIYKTFAPTSWQYNGRNGWNVSFICHVNSLIV